ncbi:ribonuclease P protein component [uncultured Porphyromonas sp.]|uniref:ribonuclease P protein component n=1 Tax=uncultured Porphyromonas sp. TaxID=159274 RepID=UPI00259787B1|nr:ribonuclease P protein component [uncultured Porphyromonas sp.]
MKEYGLTKSERLYLREEIRQLFESRSRFVCYPYRVVWRLEEPSEEPLKVLISVPKRLIRHAVDRNTIKRRTREAWRLQKGPLRALAAEQEATLLVGLLYIGDHVSRSERLSSAVSKSIARLCEEVKSASPL